MIVFVCLDTENGMMFFHRRQSKDREVRKDILKMTEAQTLWMNAFTLNQFEEGEQIFARRNVKVDEAFLEKAQIGEFCFVEDQSLRQFEDKIEKIIIYQWNREYPADFVFDLKLDSLKWKQGESFDFAGYSHEKITKTIWEKRV